MKMTETGLAPWAKKPAAFFYARIQKRSGKEPENGNFQS
jgi:hypothetical protein